MKLPFLAIVLILPAGAANWQRYVHTGKGDRNGTTEAHPIPYFTRNPLLNDADGFCNTCRGNPEQQRTEVRLIGTAHGFKIYDVFYYFTNAFGFEGEQLHWKSILIRTGPNQYREIYHYQKTQGEIFPSYLFQLGHETLIGASDDGYRGYVAQQNWWITEDGVSRIDIEPVWIAAREVLPKGYLIYPEYDGRKDFAAGMIRVKVFQYPKRGGPYKPAKGVIAVKFTLDRRQITITGVSYDPNGNPLGEDDEEAAAVDQLTK